MQRFLGISMIAGFALMVIAGPAAAKQCPKLINEINGIVGNRFDATAAAARAEAAQADQLHKAGKHEESEKIANDVLMRLKK
jgi:hypothetical protein